MTQVRRLRRKRRRMTAAARQLQGGLAQGTTEYKGDVHKTLISASKVHSKGHVAVVDSNGGYNILSNSTLARKIQQLVQREIVKEPGAVALYLENCTHIGYTKIQQHGSTRSKQELYLMHGKQQSGDLRHSRREQVRWQAPVRINAALMSNRHKHSCKKCLLKTRLWMQTLMMKRVRLSDPCVVVVGREIEHHVASGHAQHQTLCDACMRARGITG